MNNNSSQSRFAKITAKVIVLLLAVVMSFSVLPELSVDLFPVASADTITYTVPAVGNAEGLANVNAVFASWPAGTVANVTLSGDINFTDASADTYSSGFTGLVIPADVTVNLNLNGHKILFERATAGAYKLPYVYGIVNKGTLNLTGSAGSGIRIVNYRDGQKCNVGKDTVFSELEGIRNEGALTVDKNVSIYVETHNEFSEVSGSEASVDVNYREQIANANVAIYNIGDASCVVKGSTITSIAYGKAQYRQGDEKADGGVNSTAVAYGIYGGKVSVTSDAKITVEASAEAIRHKNTGSGDDNGRSKVSGIAYGIVTSKSIYVAGATITASSHVAGDRAFAHDSSSANIYAAGIYSASSESPVIPEATIIANTSTASLSGDIRGTTRYNEGTVVASSVMPNTAYDIVADNISFNAAYEVWPIGDVKAGNFVDEAGNVHATNIATSVGSHPSNMTDGALDGSNRVHIVYRYWETSGKRAIDTSIVGTEGNVGYSYNPLHDGTNVVNSEIVLDGVTNHTRPANTAISYISGAESCNEYYWNFMGVYYATTSAAFSDYNVTSSTNKGTAIKTFDTTGAVNKSVPAANNTVYIFVDYYRVAATSVKANVGTANTVSTVYTGSSIKASDLGLKILDSVYDTDYTAEYNLDFTDASLINVNFTYTGTNAAGIEDSGEGRLPVNAGTYAVKLSIPSSLEYSKNPKTNKNRRALDYTFTLIIEQAEIGRGTLDPSVELTYGETLADKLMLATKTAAGLNNEAGISGVFTFVNANDGSSYKNVCKDQIVKVKWTPSYATGVLTKNYKETEFNVIYTVSKKELNITAMDTQVVYGEAIDPTDYNVLIDGLTGYEKDKQDSVKELIAGAIQYTILPDGATDYTAYAPGSFSVGKYQIKIVLPAASAPQVLDNYECVFNWGANYGRLEVTPRPITVIADGLEREYDVENFSFTVALLIEEGGVFGNDDVDFNDYTGGLSVNNAGSYEIHLTLADVKSRITGVTALNYEVEKVVYSTGNKLYFTITKAIPSVTTPVIADRYYQQGVTLENITISSTGSSVPGVWTWENKEIVPSVKVSSYKAVFTPTDLTNYDTKVVDVTINVKPTPVVISYSATVEYGDNMPNITSYTYTSDRDPGFSIDKVKTSGNITPTTTYSKGADVTAEGYPVEISAPNFIDTDGNYTFTTATGKIMVAPRTITFKPEDITLTYGANFVVDKSSVKVTYDESLLVGSDTIEDVNAANAAPTFNYKSDFNPITKYAVGTYEITITPTFAESANYTVKTVPGTLTVVKADLTIKVNDISVEYGSEVPQSAIADLQLIGAVKGEKITDVVTTGEIFTSTTYYEGAPVTEDGYPVIIDIQSASFKNYNVSVENGTITVVKATPKITTVPTASIIYLQTLADAVFENGAVEGDVEGSFVYEAASTVPSYKATAHTGYVASFVPVDTKNYNTVSGIAVPLTVYCKPVEGTLAVSGIPMVGTTAPLTVDVSGLNPAEAGTYTVSWYLNGSTTATATGKEFTIPAGSAKQTLKVVAVANAPYTGEVEYTLTIAPALADINSLLNNLDKNFVISGLNDSIYNAEIHTVGIGTSSAISADSVIGEIVPKFNGSTAFPVDAGTYVVTIDVLTPDSSILNNIGADGKYEGKTVYSPIANYRIGEFTITPAEYTVAITVGNKTYDGTAKAYLEKVVESGKLKADDVAFDKDAAEFVFESALAGTSKITVNKVALKGADAANYELKYTLVNANGEAMILKKDLHVEVAPVDREYEKDNTNVNLSFILNEADIVAADRDLVMINEADASASIADAAAGIDKTVTVTGIALTGSKASNYNLVITNLGNITVNINKATPAYPVPQPITLTYDSARKLSEVEICDGDSRWSWLAQDKGDILAAGKYKYTAVYTPDDEDNYATVEREIAITVNKAVVTISADSFTVVYGEIEPTYSYTVTGLTGTDTIKSAADGFVLLNCTYQAGMNVNAYPIVITGEFESDNYDFEYVNGSVTVNKRPAYVEAVAVGREYEENNYNVEVKFTNLSNIYKDDGAGVVYLEADSVIGTLLDPDAGTDKLVTYDLPVLKGAKSGNYELRVLVPKVYVEIAKANLENITLPTSGQLYYGQKLGSISYTSDAISGGQGNFTMENQSTVVKETGFFTGVYKVVFTPFNSKNYNSITQYIDVTVLPASINVALSISGTTQVGKVLYVVTNDIPEDALEYLKFEWYRVDSPDADPRTGYKVASDTDTYTLVEADEGKFIVCTVTTDDKAPYECNARCATGSAIEEQTLTLWQKFVNWFYRIISNLTQLFGGAFG